MAYFPYVLFVPTNTLVAAALLELDADQVVIGLRSWSWLVMMPAMILPTCAIFYFRLQLSLTYGITTCAVEAVVPVNLPVLLIAHARHHNTVQILNPQHAQYGLGGVAIVMVIVATVLSGPPS